MKNWNCATELNNILTKKYRIGVHYKEKWDKLRVSAYFFRGSLHCLIWPGYVYKQWKPGRLGDLLWYMDVYFWPKFFYYTGLTYLIHKYQIYGYKKTYAKLAKKYPEDADELMDTYQLED